MPFRPKINDTIEINNRAFTFTEHPSAKGMPYGQTGRRATVYQLRDRGGQHHALKVFTLAFRSQQTEDQALRIEQLQTLPGLQACQRIVISPEQNGSLIQQYSDLKYAVLMPWVQGLNWQEIILSRRPLAAAVCRSTAEAFLKLMVSLEQKGIAHCDLSGPNVIIQLNGTPANIPLSLIDLEDLYAPGLQKPAKLPAGSAGYAHTAVKGGIWAADADRFAGSVLLAEMLGWCDERIRRIACGEQYFDPGEVQNSTDRFLLLAQVLKERWGDRVAKVFSQAWFSQSLSACPTFDDWQQALNPSPDPVEMENQIRRMERLGRWDAVMKGVDELLSLGSANPEISQMRARATRLLGLDGDIAREWKTASSSGLTVDWENCLRLINTAHLLAPQVVLYQAQRDQAEQELESALKIDEIESLILKRNWDEVDRSVQTVSPLQPRLAALQVKIDQLSAQSNQLDALRSAANQAIQQSNWQAAVQAVVAMEQIEPLPPEFVVIRQKALSNLDREKRIRDTVLLAQNLLDARDYTQAQQTVETILKEDPQNSHAISILTEVNQKIKEAAEFEHARNLYAAGDLKAALQTLSGLPDSIADVVSLRNRIRERTTWRAKLGHATTSMNMAEVLALLDRRPTDELDRTEVRKEADRVIALEKEMVAAESSQDFQTLINIIEQLPAAYPNRSSRYESARVALERQAAATKAQSVYDLLTAQQLASQFPPSDPQLTQLQTWINEEKMRREKIEQIHNQYDLETAQSTLKKLPDDYPFRNDFVHWLTEEEQRREEILTAVEKYDLEKWRNLLDALPDRHPLKASLQARLAFESERKEKIFRARALFDGDGILRELAGVDEDYPGYQELIIWAASEVELQASIRRAIRDGKAEEIRQHLDSLPENHPYIQDLRDWLDQETCRLLEEAQAAEREEAEQRRKQVETEEMERREVSSEEISPAQFVQASTEITLEPETEEQESPKELVAPSAVPSPPEPAKPETVHAAAQVEQGSILHYAHPVKPTKNKRKVIVPIWLIGLLALFALALGGFTIKTLFTINPTQTVAEKSLPPAKAEKPQIETTKNPTWTAAVNESTLAVATNPTSVPSLSASPVLPAHTPTTIAVQGWQSADERGLVASYGSPAVLTLLNQETNRLYAASGEGVEIYDIETNAFVDHIPVALDLEARWGSIKDQDYWAYIRRGEFQVSRDGKYFLGKDPKGLWILFDREGNLIEVPELENAYDVNLSPDGVWVTVQVDEKTAFSGSFFIYDMVSKKVVYLYNPARPNDLHNVEAISPDHRYIVSEDVVWDTADWRRLLQFSSGIFEFSPNGRLLVRKLTDDSYGVDQNAVIFYDLTADMKEKSFEIATPYLDVMLSPNSQFFAITYPDGKVEVYDMLGLQLIRSQQGEPLQKHSYWVVEDSWSTSEGGVLFLTDNGEVQYYNIPSRVVGGWTHFQDNKNLMFIDDQSISFVNYIPLDRWVVTEGYVPFVGDQVCQITWNQEPKCTFGQPALLSANGQVYTTYENNQKWQLREKIDGSGEIVTSHSPDGLMILSNLDLQAFVQSNNILVYNWRNIGAYLLDVKNDAIVKRWDGKIIRYTAISPNEKYLALWLTNPNQDSGSIVILDLETFGAVFNREWNLAGKMAFSPDSQTLVFSRYIEHDLLIYKIPVDNPDLFTKDTFVTLPAEMFQDGQTQIASSHLAFSPDGKTLALSLHDQIYLVSAETGNILHQWQAHPSGVAGLAFSPNGQFISSISFPGDVRIWETNLSK